MYVLTIQLLFCLLCTFEVPDKEQFVIFLFLELNEFDREMRVIKRQDWDSGDLGWKIIGIKRIRWTKNLRADRRIYGTKHLMSKSFNTPWIWTKINGLGL